MRTAYLESSVLSVAVLGARFSQWCERFIHNQLTVYSITGTGDLDSSKTPPKTSFKPN